MESSNTNNKKVDGSMVKELKRKGSTSERGDEAGKLILCKTCGKSYHPNETIPDGKDQQCSDCSELFEPIMNLKKKKAKNSTKMDNKPSTSAESGNKTEANKKIAAVSESDAALMMLRKNSGACVESMVKIPNITDKDSTKQPEEGNSKGKEKCVEVCASQQIKVALKNKGKELCIDPRPVSPPTPPELNDSMMDEFQQFVKFREFWKNGTKEKTNPPNSFKSQSTNNIGASSSRPEMMNKTNSSRESSGLMKHTEKVDDWSEKELDILWLGVRRYGQGDWNSIHSHPNLQKRSPQELAERWEKELHEIILSAAINQVNMVPDIP